MQSIKFPFNSTPSNEGLIANGSANWPVIWLANRFSLLKRARKVLTIDQNWTKEQVKSGYDGQVAGDNGIDNRINSFQNLQFN